MIDEWCEDGKSILIEKANFDSAITAKPVKKMGRLQTLRFTFMLFTSCSIINIARNFLLLKSRQWQGNDNEWLDPVFLEDQFGQHRNTNTLTFLNDTKTNANRT